MIDATARIHGTADLEADVSVGPRTSVWHRAQVRAGARIGADCIIGRDAFIDEGVVIGDRVKIQNAALVYHGVTVEDGVFIGPNAILTNDRYPRAITADGELARADDWDVIPITLRQGARSVPARSSWPATTSGRFATVGAGRRRDPRRPDHALVVGNPARRLGWVCACGAAARWTRAAQPTGGATHAGRRRAVRRCATRLRDRRRAAASASRRRRQPA